MLKDSIPSTRKRAKNQRVDAQGSSSLIFRDSSDVNACCAAQLIRSKPKAILILTLVPRIIDFVTSLYLLPPFPKSPNTLRICQNLKAYTLQRMVG